MKFKGKSGISLVVLIITIVVIIILAAAVILTVSKNNPVESAKKSVFISDLSSYQDELSMYIGNEYIKKEGNYNIDSLNNQPLESVIDINSKYNEKFTILSGKIVGTDKLTEQEKDWAQTITGGVIGYVSLANYTDSEGKKAYVPKDFTVSENEAEKKIATGLVVKDNKGNEFVWIPVEYTTDEDFIAKFIRRQGYTGGILQTNYPFATFVEPYGSANQSEIDEYNKMIASVKKYQGYYIARYEASKDASGNAQSKPNVQSWTDIFWGNSMTDLAGGAVEKARAMYPVATASVGTPVSTLIYGVQWDTALDFIEKYGIKDTTYKKDSTGKGAYGKLVNTGSNSANALNNIYDMAGNVWEWTMETFTDNRAIRGGSYVNSGLNNPVSVRNYYGTTDKNIYTTFRIALYMK